MNNIIKWLIALLTIATGIAGYYMLTQREEVISGSLLSYIPQEAQWIIHTHDCDATMTQMRRSLPYRQRWAQQELAAPFRRLYPLVIDIEYDTLQHEPYEAVYAWIESEYLQGSLMVIEYPDHFQKELIKELNTRKGLKFMGELYYITNAQRDTLWMRLQPDLLLAATSKQLVDASYSRRDPISGNKSLYEQFKELSPLHPQTFFIRNKGELVLQKKLRQTEDTKEDIWTGFGMNIARKKITILPKTGGEIEL